MPTVEKTSNGRVHVRGIGEFEAGDRAEVSTADAQYLVDERGDFEVVDEGGTNDDSELVNAVDISDALLIESGVCPWCDEYEGDAVGQHAASAHPDAWDDYKED